MTPERLEELREWAKYQRGSNRVLARDHGRQSGNELAVELVDELLAEVERLRGQLVAAAGAARKAHHAWNAGVDRAEADAPEVAVGAQADQFRAAFLELLGVLFPEGTDR